MTEPEITDDTDCPFLVLAIIHLGSSGDFVGKPSQKPLVCSQDQQSVISE